MKGLLLILALTSRPFFGFVQEPIAALELPEHNILYRGYPNIILPAVTNNNESRVEIRGNSDVKITQQSDGRSYSVRPSTDSKKYVLIHVVLISDSTLDTLRTVEYRSVYLPEPTLYWGGSRNQSKANIKSAKLFAKYPPEIPLNATFNVLSWKIDFNGDSISGNGSNISKAEELLKTVKKKSEVTIETVVKGPDGIERKIVGTWIVVPWNEEIDEGPYIIKCSG